LLSGDVIKKVVNGIVNIDAYKSNRTDVINGWSEQSPEDGLYDERLLMVGCIAVMLSKFTFFSQQFKAKLQWSFAPYFLTKLFFQMFFESQPFSCILVKNSN